MLVEYSDVFADKLPNEPPHPKAPLHRIRLKDEHKSINGNTYRIPGMYLGKMQEFINKQLSAGRIRPSSSHMSAGTMIVPKKDSHSTVSTERHVVHDYRALNENTVPDHTPLPRQDEIMTASAKEKIRSKIDLVSVMNTSSGLSMKPGMDNLSLNWTKIDRDRPILDRVEPDQSDRFSSFQLCQKNRSVRSILISGTDRSGPSPSSHRSDRLDRPTGPKSL
jgi:hypothetical protein